jgi:S1-C subfamily serine protease
MGSKTTRAAAGILLLIFCWLSAGCVHPNTSARRDASFLPYESAQIGQVSLRQFLFARSAVLLEGDQLSVTASNADARTVWIKGTVSSMGMSAAIDARGYFLTAAHCVQKEPLTLVFLHQGQLESQAARVVWRGDISKKEPDLAILRVPIPLQDVFEWTPEFTNGKSVVATGLSTGSARLMQIQCVAGKILRLTKGSKAISPHYLRISHDAPLHHGDSGGPLAFTDGRLVGINSSVEVQFQWKHFSFEPVSCNAERPDLDWLRQVIRQDATVQSGATTNQIKRGAGGGGMKAGL